MPAHPVIAASTGAALKPRRARYAVALIGYDASEMVLPS